MLSQRARLCVIVRPYITLFCRKTATSETQSALKSVSSYNVYALPAAHQDGHERDGNTEVDALEKRPNHRFATGLRHPQPGTLSSSRRMPDASHILITTSRTALTSSILAVFHNLNNP